MNPGQCQQTGHIPTGSPELRWQTGKPSSGSPGPLKQAHKEAGVSPGQYKLAANNTGTTSETTGNVASVMNQDRDVHYATSP